MSDARRLAIRARHVIAFDGRGHRLLRDGVVVIEGDRILHVGPRFDGRVDETVDAPRPRAHAGPDQHARAHRRLAARPVVHRGPRERAVLVLGPLRDAARARRRAGRGGEPRLRRLLDGRAAPRRRHHGDGDRRARASTSSSAPPRYGLRVYMGLTFRSGTLAHARRAARRVGVGRGGRAARGSRRAVEFHRQPRRRARRPRAVLLWRRPGRHLHGRAAARRQAVRGRDAPPVHRAHLAVGRRVQRDGRAPRRRRRSRGCDELGVLGDNTDPRPRHHRRRLVVDELSRRRRAA